MAYSYGGYESYDPFDPLGSAAQYENDQRKSGKTIDDIQREIDSLKKTKVMGHEVENTGFLESAIAADKTKQRNNERALQDARAAMYGRLKDYAGKATSILSDGAARVGYDPQLELSRQAQARARAEQVGMLRERMAQGFGHQGTVAQQVGAIQAARAERDAARLGASGFVAPGVPRAQGSLAGLLSLRSAVEGGQQATARAGAELSDEVTRGMGDTMQGAGAVRGADLGMLGVERGVQASDQNWLARREAMADAYRAAALNESKIGTGLELDLLALQKDADQGYDWGQVGLQALQGGIGAGSQLAAYYAGLPSGPTPQAVNYANQQMAPGLMGGSGPAQAAIERAYREGLGMQNSYLNLGRR